jgi:hypothetical protein
MRNIPGSYQDEEFKTTKDYGAGVADENGTEVGYLPPIMEANENVEPQRTIQKDTLLESEIQKQNQ